MVVRIAGPIKPRIAQRRQVQRTFSLIEGLLKHSSLGRCRLPKAGYTTTLQLLRTIGSVAKHQKSHANENQRPQLPKAQVKKFENAEIAEQQEGADADEYGWAERQIFGDLV